MVDGKPVPGSLYIYAPNKGAPVFFCVAFFLSGGFHLWQCLHYKCFKLMALHLLCCLMFTVGFAMREYGAFHYTIGGDNLNVYIASTALIYMAPPLLELANYHVLGRILYYVPYLSPLHPGRVLTTFGILSSVVEALNAIGVTYLANRKLPERLQNLGKTLMQVSLIVQIVVIMLFCVLAFTFHQRCAKAGVNTRAVSSPLLILYISTFLILVRCIFRTVEHFDAAGLRPGVDLATLSPMLRYEWFFYVFEASLMLINTFLWNWWHPRRYLPQSYRTYLAQDGVTELKGPGWEDDRSFLATVMDPFGWFDSSKKKKEPPFWETNGYSRANGNV